MAISDESFAIPNAATAQPVPKPALPAQASPAVPADEILQRVVKGAHDTIDKLAETAAPQVHRMGESLSEASDALHANAQQWRATGDAWADSTRDTVREHPLAAIALALAAGVLIARLTR